MSMSKVRMSKEEMDEYWTEFLEVLDEMDTPLSTGNEDLYRSSIGFSRFPAGEATAQLFCVIDRKNARIRAEIYLSNKPKSSKKHAEKCYQMLKEKRDSIERELGFRLEWLGKPERKDGKNYRIAIHNEDIDLEDRSDWPRQHEWLIEHLCKMRPVVEKYVSKIGG